jgi:hypothetical protein
MGLFCSKWNWVESDVSLDDEVIMKEKGKQ